MAGQCCTCLIFFCIRDDALKVVRDADALIKVFLGEPSIAFDACVVGGLSHRYRLFWTNMMSPATLRRLLPPSHP